MDHCDNYFTVSSIRAKQDKPAAGYNCIHTSNFLIQTHASYVDMMCIKLPLLSPCAPFPTPPTRARVRPERGSGIAMREETRDDSPSQAIVFGTRVVAPTLRRRRCSVALASVAVCQLESGWLRRPALPGFFFFLFCTCAASVQSPESRACVTKMAGDVVRKSGFLPSVLGFARRALISARHQVGGVAVAKRVAKRPQRVSISAALARAGCYALH